MCLANVIMKGHYGTAVDFQSATTQMVRLHDEGNHSISPLLREQFALSS
ncbi:MAG: hypothetical protein JO297_16115 [Nitrososphaeraceae archaeon]|nr:hypothetical protein [Nitrososphaeraceae archaeon]